MRLCSLALILLVLSGVAACEGEGNDPDPVEELPLGEFIDKDTYRVFPRPGDNFDVAEFRLWLPASDLPVRAILVLAHSYNINGLGMVNSDFWQGYARKEQLALLAVNLKTISESTPYYAEAQQGSGRALLEALTKIAENTGHDYVQDLPFLFRGYSAGGLFSHSFSAFLPERVLAFANIRGGSLSLTPDVNLDIPGLMFYGEDDLPQRNARIIEVVELKRSIGANWGLIREPGYDHYGALSKPDKLLLLFFSKVLSKRLSTASNELLQIETDSGWLGDHATFSIQPYADFAGSKNNASWLIDREFAEHWQAYQLD